MAEAQFFGSTFNPGQGVGGNVNLDGFSPPGQDVLPPPLRPASVNRATDVPPPPGNSSPATDITGPPSAGPQIPSGPPGPPNTFQPTNSNTSTTGGEKIPGRRPTNIMPKGQQVQAAKPPKAEATNTYVPPKKLTDVGKQLTDNTRGGKKIEEARQEQAESMEDFNVNDASVPMDPNIGGPDVKTINEQTKDAVDNNAVTNADSALNEDSKEAMDKATEEAAKKQAENPKGENETDCPDALIGETGDALKESADKEKEKVDKVDETGDTNVNSSEDENSDEAGKNLFNLPKDYTLVNEHTWVEDKQNLFNQLLPKGIGFSSTQQRRDPNNPFDSNRDNSIDFYDPSMSDQFWEDDNVGTGPGERYAYNVSLNAKEMTLHNNKTTHTFTPGDSGADSNINSSYNYSSVTEQSSKDHYEMTFQYEDKMSHDNGDTHSGFKAKLTYNTITNDDMYDKIADSNKRYDSSASFEYRVSAKDINPFSAPRVVAETLVDRARGVGNAFGAAKDWIFGG